MKVAILTEVPHTAGHKAVRTEAERRGHTIEFVSLHSQEISKKAFTELADRFAGFDVVHQGKGLGIPVTAALHALLEERGVFCVNSLTRVPSNVGDKVFQATNLVRHDLPIPRSWRSHRPEFLLLADELDLPFIAKNAHGSQGKSVWLIEKPEDMQRFTFGKGYLFQECVPNTGDFRVHVVGGHAFCPYKRTPPPGDFRANVSRGGGVVRIEDENERKIVEELAVKTAQAMHLDYCGVDIICSERDGQYYVLEVNTNPGFKYVEECTGEAFAPVIVDYYETVANGR